MKHQDKFVASLADSLSGKMPYGKAQLRHDDQSNFILVESKAPLNLSAFIPSNTLFITQDDNFVSLLLNHSSLLNTFVFLFGILGAATTIIRMSRSFRQLGSKASLAYASMLTIVLDFLFAVFTLKMFHINVPSTLLLLEFGPYFFMLIGFHKVYSLAHRVLSHRHQGKGNVVAMICAVEECYLGFLLEYAIKILLFAILAIPSIHGSRELCILCIMLLVFDSLLLHTFLLGILTFRQRLYSHRPSSPAIPKQKGGNGWVKLLMCLSLVVMYALGVLQPVNPYSINNTGTLMPLTFICDEEFTVFGCTSLFSLIQESIHSIIADLHYSQTIRYFILFALPLSLICNYYLLKKQSCNENEEKGRETIPLSLPPKTTPSTLTIKQETSDVEVLSLIESGKIPLYSLEQMIKDPLRAVHLRRLYLQKAIGDSLYRIPHLHYLDYSSIHGTNCENVIGFVPIPLGVAGPLLVDDLSYYLPMATTEGALVASTSRGMKALTYSGGVRTALTSDGMTRGPVLSMPTLSDALQLVTWITDNFGQLERVFNATSRHLQLLSIDTRPVGRLVYLRFKATTGDAMGMNMLSRATEQALSLLHHTFPSLKTIALSGNYCADKKATALNWIEGRGKSITAEAIIPEPILNSILKTNIKSIVETNVTKNLVGSALAGSIGGFNAHAANIVAALFIALGQDPAQVISSSSCLTLLEERTLGAYGNSSLESSLYISVTMPSIEVGYVGGGTTLTAQRACLDMLKLSAIPEGQRAARLACIVAATVMAGELSLLASLTEGTLVQAHQTLNGQKSIREQ